jgi:hypothetical protein
LHRENGPLRNARAGCTGKMDPSEMLVQVAQGIWTPLKCSCKLQEGNSTLENALASCKRKIPPFETLLQVAREIHILKNFYYGRKSSEFYHAKNFKCSVA